MSAVVVVRRRVVAVVDPVVGAVSPVVGTEIVMVGRLIVIDVDVVVDVAVVEADVDDELVAELGVDDELVAAEVVDVDPDSVRVATAVARLLRSTVTSGRSTTLVPGIVLDSSGAVDDGNTSVRVSPPGLIT